MSDKPIEQADGTQATPPPTPDTSQDSNANEGGFTQADIDRIVGERVKRATESATNKVLESLGIENLDQGKAFFEAEKARKEAEMSEVEKAQERANQLQEQLDLMKEQNTKLAQQRLDDKRDSSLLRLLDKAHNPTNALALIKMNHVDSVKALMNGDEFNADDAAKLVATFTESNAYMFQSSAKGSPSNSGGRVPNPNKDAYKSLSTSISKLINQS